jgi:predicted acetyltransferase
MFGPAAESTIMSNFAPLPPQDIPAMAEIVADSFNMPEEKCELWIQRSGIEHWRCFSDSDSTILGGLMRIPMAQWFGGRPVSMTGLAGVAVSTAGRGRRVGQDLMRRTLLEMRQEGTALSALYGSTTSFYRRCGYERAGSRFMAEVPVRDLPSRSGPLDVRPLTPETHPQVEALQAEHVRDHASLLRGPYLWVRVRGPRGLTAQGYGFYRGDVLEGYTYLFKQLAGFQDNTLEATDVVLTTPDAMATFMGLLAGHRALFTKARWPSPPASALLLSMTEPWQLRLSLEEHWMLRIVSLVPAISQRGYPVHLTAELHLHIDDPWFADHNGPWILRCQKGAATLEPGGRGDLRLDIGAMASLYTGFLSAESLALAGRAQGEPATLAQASTIFGGWTPNLADFF